MPFRLREMKMWPAIWMIFLFPWLPAAIVLFCCCFFSLLFIQRGVAKQTQCFSGTACFAFIKLHAFTAGELPFTDHMLFDWTAPLKQVVFSAGSRLPLQRGTERGGGGLHVHPPHFGFLRLYFWGIQLSVTDYSSNHYAATSNLSEPQFQSFPLSNWFTMEWTKVLRGITHSKY